ncbi:MAG: hypothetical protein AAEJ52_12545 [Myxococcota bacterium]
MPDISTATARSGGVPSDPQALLRKALETGRIHTAYLMSGPGSAPRDAALAFARRLVCTTAGTEACEECIECRRSTPGEPIALDGNGRKGPLLRHVGDHADLFWIERGTTDTRVTINQIRALQGALRLRSTEGGRRAAVIADAEQMSPAAENALLRILEEPPPSTTLILATATSAGLLATVRSRCQRIVFDPRPTSSDDPDRAELAARINAIPRTPLPELLDWAAEHRGKRATVVDGVNELLETASDWLRDQVAASVHSGHSLTAGRIEAQLDAFGTLNNCRKTLAQHNANPQMVVERALFALREAASR